MGRKPPQSSSKTRHGAVRHGKLQRLHRRPGLSVREAPKVKTGRKVGRKSVETHRTAPNVRGLRVDDQELEAPEVPSERQAMVRWCRGALSLFFEGVFLAKGLSQGPRALRDAVHGATARATGEGSEAGFGSRDAFDTGWNHVKSHAKEAKSGRAGAKSGGRRRKSVCDA